MIAREPSRRLFLKQSVSGVTAASVAANYTPVLESEDFVQQAGAAAHLRSSSSSQPPANQKGVAMKPIAPKFLFILSGLLLWFSSAELVAQEFTGNIVGTVADSSAGVIPGVTVTVSGETIQGTRTTVSESNGTYRITLLPPGTYQVVYELAGFATLTRQGVLVGVGRTSTINATLEVAALGISHYLDPGRYRTAKRNLELSVLLQRFCQSSGGACSRHDRGDRRAVGAYYLPNIALTNIRFEKKFRGLGLGQGHTISTLVEVYNIQNANTIIGQNTQTGTTTDNLGNTVPSFGRYTQAISPESQGSACGIRSDERRGTRGFSALTEQADQERDTSMDLHKLVSVLLSRHRWSSCFKGAWVPNRRRVSIPDDDYGVAGPEDEPVSSPHDESRGPGGAGAGEGFTGPRGENQFRHHTPRGEQYDEAALEVSHRGRRALVCVQGVGQSQPGAVLAASRRDAAGKYL